MHIHSRTCGHETNNEGNAISPSRKCNIKQFSFSSFELTCHIEATRAVCQSMLFSVQESKASSNAQSNVSSLQGRPGSIQESHIAANLTRGSRTYQSPRISCILAAMRQEPSTSCMRHEQLSTALPQRSLGFSRAASMCCMSGRCCILGHTAWLACCPRSC